MKIKLLKRIVIKTLSILFIPLKNFIPKSNIVILGTSSRYSYKDNTRYLIEYLNLKGMENLYWVTDSREIEEHLDQLGIRYIGWKSPLKMIWISLRAKVVIDSGTKFFNPLGVLDNCKSVKLTTLHGNGPKANFSRFHPPSNSKIAIQQIQDHYAFDYVNYPSKYSAIEVARRCHLLPNEKIISLGYPRCDQYFDSNYVKVSYEKKATTKSLYPGCTKTTKVILYTPTWRPYDYCFPLDLMPGLDLFEFNSWLVENNYVFFYTVHSAHAPLEVPLNLDRIRFIDGSGEPLFDINQFMLEVDFLLNDYSTTSTDFAILNRPQVFFMPDYDYYKVEKGFVEDYRDILPGAEIKSYDHFLQLLTNIEKNPVAYTKKYNAKRIELLNKYYDMENGESCEQFYCFINSILVNQIK
jgi:CDP-glycerol glycerophosphotransferase (TagB/SpsB family)